MKLSVKIFGIIFLSILFITDFCFSQSLLIKIQNKFNSVKDLSADFVQYSNGNINLKGKFKFKQENKIRIEFKNNIIVSDGKTNWSYNKKRNKIIISEIDEENPSVFSLNKLINEYPGNSIVTGKKEGKYLVLKIEPKKNSGLNFIYAELFFQNSYRIKKILIKGTEYGKLEITFNNYKEDNGFKDSIFKITPSKGTETIDLR